MKFAFVVHGCQWQLHILLLWRVPSPLFILEPPSCPGCGSRFIMCSIWTLRVDVCNYNCLCVKLHGWEGFCIPPNKNYLFLYIRLLEMTQLTRKLPKALRLIWTGTLDLFSNYYSILGAHVHQFSVTTLCVNQDRASREFQTKVEVSMFSNFKSTR